MSEEQNDANASSIADSSAVIGMLPCHASSNEEAAFALEMERSLESSVIRTLDGDEIGDEFDQDAMNYRILLEKIDQLLDRLKLDA